MSLNCNGLNNKTKRNAIFNNLKKMGKETAILLQETHSTQQVEKQRNNEWGAAGVFSHGTTKSHGCVTLFHFETEVKLLHQCIEVNGCFIIVDI